MSEGVAKGVRFRVRPEEGWLALLLLVLMLCSVNWAMEEANWVEGLSILQWCSLGGLFLALVLTGFGLRGLLAHPLSLLLSAPWTLYLLLRVSAPGLGWREGLLLFGARLLHWISVAFGRGVSGDNLIFLFYMAILIWWLGYLGGWFLFRHHSAWPAAILSGLAMVLTRYWGPSELNFWLTLYLLVALSLIIRVNLCRREEEWQAERVKYWPGNAFDFLRDGFIFSLIVITLALSMPLLTWDTLRSREWGGQGLWDWSQRQFNRLFSLEGYSSPAPAYVSFGDRLTLGGAVHLGEEVVMAVRAPQRWYWRAMVYDRYDGRGWENSDQEHISLPPSQDLPQEGDLFLREEMEQEITLYLPTAGQLFAAAQPVKVDLPVEARLTTYPGWWMRRAEGGEAISERMAGVSTLTSKVAVGPRRSYTVVSALSGATVEMLRQAAPLYPPGMEERYLQLPPTLPQRVRDLAKEITEGYDNAYDKAAALERYLRRLSYNRTIEASPSGRDVVDYFLFESKEGYCDYFASAMVVMARAVGIPARLAVGYAGGEYREESEDYVVRRSASHAWVEVFFPLYGWVEFEPTPSQSLIARPRGEFEAGEGVVPGVGPGRPLEPFLNFPEYPGLFEPAPTQAAPWPLGAVLGVSILAFSIVLTSVYGLVRRRRWLALPPAERAYRGMASLSTLLGLKALSSQTPLEYGSAVAERLPEEGESALHISALFVRERFSQEGINEAEGQEALRSWHGLRWAASKALLGRAREAIGSAHELAGKGWRRLLHRPSPGAGAGVDRRQR